MVFASKVARFLRRRAGRQVGKRAAGARARRARGNPAGMPGLRGPSERRGPDPGRPRPAEGESLKKERTNAREKRKDTKKTVNNIKEANAQVRERCTGRTEGSPPFALLRRETDRCTKEKRRREEKDNLHRREAAANTLRGTVLRVLWWWGGGDFSPSLRVSLVL